MPCCNTSSKLRTVHVLKAKGKKIRNISNHMADTTIDQIRGKANSPNCSGLQKLMHHKYFHLVLMSIKIIKKLKISTNFLNISFETKYLCFQFLCYSQVLLSTLFSRFHSTFTFAYSPSTCCSMWSPHTLAIFLLFCPFFHVGYYLNFICFTRILYARWHETKFYPFH